MTTFVLIHGAWHGAWCWHKVLPELKKRKHNAIAIDLAGHGMDRTPASKVTLQTYAERVGEVLDVTQEPVTLVGHSMGGFVISAAAELRPAKVNKLVYLAAALVESGITLSEFGQAADLQADGEMAISEDQQSILINPGIVREAFYADCSDADVCLAEMLLTPQPIAPFHTALATTPENWGRIPRHYIECLQDRALPLHLQRKCQDRLPCEKVSALNTSHSPFFSVPVELAELLIEG